MKTKPPNKMRYSLLNILTGSDLSKRKIPVMEARSIKPGPVLWLTACAHGDEIGGIVVVQEIFKILKKMPLLKGAVYAFPLMNSLGIETASRHITLSEEDLNRSFPGSPDGSLAERIAHKIFTAIIETKPTLVIDLHNDWTQTIPYALIDPLPAFRDRQIYEKVKFFIKKSGLIVIGEQKESMEEEEVHHSLTFSMIKRNIPAISLELGESYVINEKNVEIGVNAILNILFELGMISYEKKFAYPMPENVRGRILKYSDKPSSSKSGILRFAVKAGDIVSKGQAVAKVYNAFGKIQETITAQHESVVLGLSDTHVSFPGAPIMAFGIIPK